MGGKCMWRWRARVSPTPEPQGPVQGSPGQFRAREIGLCRQWVQGMEGAWRAMGGYR